MIVDHIDNLETYAKNSFYEYLKLIKNTNWVELDGKTVLSDDAFFTVSTLDSRVDGNGMWEAHKIYYDIHYVISGTEVIGYSHIKDLVAMKEEYNESKDMVVPEGTTLQSPILLREGMFAVVLPQDGHMPLMSATDSSEKLKKVIFKIKMSTWNK